MSFQGFLTALACLVIIAVGLVWLAHNTSVL